MSKDMSNAVDEFLSIRQEETKLKLKKRKFRANCTHVKKGKGRPDVRPHNSGQNHAQCKNCETIIDFDPYINDNFEAGLEELREAARVVSNAAHIIKLRSATAGDKSSRELCSAMSTAILANEEIPAILEAIIKNKGKKKNKKKIKRSGEVIGTTLSVLNGGKKKAKKGW